MIANVLVRSENFQKMFQSNSWFVVGHEV